MPELPGRARSIEEYGPMMEQAMAGERSNHRPYQPQDGDVFITSWAKSGTTMLQQMFHQLRMAAATGAGHMDFDDVSRVVPWDDTAYMIDFDMAAPQPAAPRGFKSHREYERLPSGMRYIVSLRDPKETFVSFYRFMNGWHFERDAVPIDQFLPFWMMGGPGGCDYFTHLLSWYARRDEPDTMLVNYKTVVKDRAAAIRQMGGFIGDRARTHEPRIHGRAQGSLRRRDDLRGAGEKLRDPGGKRFNQGASERQLGRSIASCDC